MQLDVRPVFAGIEHVAGSQDGEVCAPVPFPLARASYRDALAGTLYSERIGKSSGQ
jgi:hypothetical protein